jgi:hypothetical protein
MKKQTPRFGNSTTHDEMKGDNKVLSRARRLGIAGDVEALQLALAACIGVYDQILATAPPQLFARQLATRPPVQLPTLPAPGSPVR